MSRVLIVDDEASLRFTLSELVSDRGHEAITVPSGEEALAHVEQADVVVTDLSMPGMSGFELARSMLDLRPDLPIVMTSGYLSADDQHTGVQLGLRALILKPNTVDELAGVLSQLFRSPADPAE